MTDKDKRIEELEARVRELEETSTRSLTLLSHLAEKSGVTAFDMMRLDEIARERQKRQDGESDADEPDGRLLAMPKPGLFESIFGFSL